MTSHVSTSDQYEVTDQSDTRRAWTQPHITVLQGNNVETGTMTFFETFGTPYSVS